MANYRKCVITVFTDEEEMKSARDALLNALPIEVRHHTHYETTVVDSEKEIIDLILKKRFLIVYYEEGNNCPTVEEGNLSKISNVLNSMTKPDAPVGEMMLAVRYLSLAGYVEIPNVGVVMRIRDEED